MRILFDDVPVDDESLFIEPDDDELPLFIELVPLLDVPLELLSVVEPVELGELDESVLEPVEGVVVDDDPELVSLEVEPLVVAPGERPIFEFCWPSLLGDCVLGVWVVVLPGLLPVPVPLLVPPVPPVCASAIPPIASPIVAASAVSRSRFMSYSHRGGKRGNQLGVPSG